MLVTDIRLLSSPIMCVELYSILYLHGVYTDNFTFHIRLIPSQINLAPIFKNITLHSQPTSASWYLPQTSFHRHFVYIYLCASSIYLAFLPLQ